MTSILTNNSATAALATLRSISSGLEETQARISSGLRVGNASDNAAYWSIATTMRSDSTALSAVQDAIGLGAAKVDTAYAGMESAIDVVKEIKNKLVTAQESSADKTKIQEEISQLQEQLKGIADSASFSGENWLKNAVGGSQSVVGSFVRDSEGNISVKKIEYDLNADSLLFEEGVDADVTYGQGLLDGQAQFSGTDGLDVKVGVNGIDTTYALKAFTTQSLMDGTTSYQFDTTTSGQSVALNASGAAEFIKIEGTDKWLKVQATTADVTGQDVAFKDGSNVSYYVDLGSTATNVTDANADFSLYNLDITELADVAANMGTGFSQDDALAFMTQFVDTQLSKMTSAASNLGSISMRIGLQEDFVAKLSDTLDSGIGRLVDADMNEESTRLKALQTQQQLAIQALSIANSDSQNVLSLFR
jgi:flagellin